MNFDFLDEKPALFSQEQKIDEIGQLYDLARNVGSYRWSYKPEFQNQENVDGNDHIGPTAQQIQKIPGLESAVVPDENGNLTVDTNYLSLATIGLLAALTRIVLGGNNDSNQIVSSELQEPETESATDTTADGEGVETFPNDQFPIDSESEVV